MAESRAAAAPVAAFPGAANLEAFLAEAFLAEAFLAESFLAESFLAEPFLAEACPAVDLAVAAFVARKKNFLLLLMAYVRNKLSPAVKPVATCSLC